MAVAKFNLTVNDGRTSVSTKKMFALQWARLRVKEGSGIEVEVQEIDTGKRWEVKKNGRKVETTEL